MAPSSEPQGNRRRRTLAYALIAGTVLLLAGAAAMLTHTVIDAVRHRRGVPPRPQRVAYGRTSADCRSCHADIYRQWETSDHAHAHRPVSAAADADAFGTPTQADVEGVHYSLRWHSGHPEFTEKRPGHPDFTYTADFVLGYRPLRQYIVPFGKGRYQAAELAFDPAKKDWFNVFGAEHRQPGEWGQWQGRGMNWNSMCAHCHLTEFSKNYDPASDGYRSTWLEHGVGCVQCHGDLTPDHASPGYKTPPALWKQMNDRVRSEQTCAPCHARNELLTGEPRPGWNYNDHFRIALPTDAHVFYPDGQMRDEDFNWTSFLTSRMGGKAGVTCLDCHDPHTGKTRLAVDNNALCLQCHVANNSRGAPAIDPVAHSHHKPDSAGNQCVTCHMPMTTYMQRDPRHDHGFLRPDPLLTKELGIPNACDRCHADKGVEWEIEAADKWYGDKMQSRQRERARAVAAAQQGAATAPGKLLALAASEEVPAWKATLLELTRPWAQQPAVTAAARGALSDADPLVRSAAVQVLTDVASAGDATPSSRSAQDALRPRLSDPVRLVRLDAEWALSPELTADSAGRKELDAYLALSADQPGGELRIAQDLFNRGQPEAAEARLNTATQWDPNSGAIFETLGLVEDRLGKAPQAASALWRATQLEPQNGNVAFEAGLAFAGAGKLPDAELALRTAIERDPALDRAWYNLGLLLAQTGKPAEAIQMFKRAEALAPDVADYPYARATVLWAQGDRDGARAAARRVLEIDPNNANARQLLQTR